jgi:4-diphosphocytidyl-2-C-methyl-D-erythritol kinase
MAAFAAPAKINLFLHVLAREASGYHQIETLFCRLALADTLEIEPARKGIALHVDGEDTGPADDNLVVRAARLLGRQYGHADAVRITLRKRIPVGAGLGGGSSDAAATLRALAKLHADANANANADARANAGPDASAGAGADVRTNADASARENRNAMADSSLLRMAQELGSDVPFFLSGAALALGWGRGERLLALPPLPGRPVIIMTPPERIATADAYRALAARRDTAPSPVVARVLNAGALADWNEAERLARNDFEDVAFDRIPELRSVRDALNDHGARIAMLCGSGSALFGVFDSIATRDAATRVMRHAFDRFSCIETHTAAADEPGVDRPDSQD